MQTRKKVPLLYKVFSDNDKIFCREFLLHLTSTNYKCNNIRIKFYFAFISANFALEKLTEINQYIYVETYTRIGDLNFYSVITERIQRRSNVVAKGGEQKHQKIY